MPAINAAPSLIDAFHMTEGGTANTDCVEEILGYDVDLAPDKVKSGGAIESETQAPRPEAEDSIAKERLRALAF